MPRPVEVFSEAVRAPIFVIVGASVVSIDVPTVNVADLLQRRILARVVVVHSLKEAAQAIAVVELKVTHSMIAVARA